jgi:hypothetical protein
MIREQAPAAMIKNNNKPIPETTGVTQVELLSRRTVLRDGLVAGFCLFVPITLLGACSRETESNTPALLKKVSREAAKYQDQPMGTQTCSNCMNFNSAQKTCQRVEGEVSPDGWCILWGANA